MSNATVTGAGLPLMMRFWKANASVPPLAWAVNVSVNVVPLPVSGAVNVANSLVRMVPPTNIGSLSVNDAPPSKV